MNEIIENTPSELLSHLLDGELDPAQDTMLFSALAQNEDLRSELREMLAIRESVKKDDEAYAAPAGLAGLILAQAGIGSTLVAPTVAGTAAATGIMITLRNLLWNPFSTAAIATLMTALVGSFIFKNQQNKPITARTEQASAQQATNLSIPVITSEPEKPAKANRAYARVSDNRQRSPLTANSVKNSAGRVFALANGINSNPAPMFAMASDNPPTTNIAVPATLLRFYYSPVKESEFIPTDDAYRKFDKSGIDNFSSKKYYDMMMYFRSSAASSFPDVSIGSPTEKTFYNFSLGALLFHYDALNIGFEVGSESFGQVFYNIENNMAVRYEQYPRFLYVGLAIRSIWDKNIEFLAGGQPFAQVSLAATQVGPLGKAIAGVQFISQSGLGYCLGLEGSWLTYQNQNKWYSTKKLGITYGLSMQF